MLSIACVTVGAGANAEEQLWLFVEYFEPCHKGRRYCAPWASPVLPTWPHLAEIATTSERYDWVLASAVEGVHLLAPDANDAKKVYAVLNTDRALWHER